MVDDESDFNSCWGIRCSESVDRKLHRKNRGWHQGGALVQTLYSKLLDYSGMWLKIDAGIFVSTPAINDVRQQQ